MKLKMNGKIVEFPDDKMGICPLSKDEEIAMLKAKLAETDYKAIKYAEGLYSEEDYAPIKAQRQAFRDRINELENGK